MDVIEVRLKDLIQEIRSTAGQGTAHEEVVVEGGGEEATAS
jgi:hypothetical protein